MGSFGSFRYQPGFPIWLSDSHGGIPPNRPACSLIFSPPHSSGPRGRQRVGLSLPRTVTAADDDALGCSNRTLRGDYGILVSGVRGLGPGVRESFVGTALRT